MQTMYYTTNHDIRHTGNVVDLNEYRRKLAAAGKSALCPELRFETYTPVENVEPRLRRSEERRARRAMVTDLLSSAAVLLTTLVVTAQFL